MSDGRKLSRAASADRRVVRSRDAILRAAGRLLESGNVPDITYKQIAAEAGVGRATLYRHWPEPWDLLLEAMEVLIPAIDLGQGTIRDRLVRELERRLTWFNTSTAGASIAAIINLAEQDPRIARMRDRTLGQAHQMLTDAIAQAVADGELEVSTPAAIIATALVGSLLYERHMLGHALTPKGVYELVDCQLKAWLVSPTN